LFVAAFCSRARSLSGLLRTRALFEKQFPTKKNSLSLLNTPKVNEEAPTGPLPLAEVVQGGGGHFLPSLFFSLFFSLEDAKVS